MRAFVYFLEEGPNKVCMSSEWLHSVLRSYSLLPRATAA